MPDSTSLAWSWNARKQPVNPYAVDVPARKPSALAVWIALYEQDKSDQREQAEAMSRAAEEYLFSVAHCNPWHYDELNDALIEKAKRHAELHRVDPLTLIRDDVASFLVSCASRWKQGLSIWKNQKIRAICLLI